MKIISDEGCVMTYGNKEKPPSSAQLSAKCMKYYTQFFVKIILPGIIVFAQLL